jgi:uncharacterized protein YcgI (DUF1989 family)
VPPIEMQYFNFEENPEVRFPSNVCESVQEGISASDDYLTRCNSKFEDSMSSTQNFQLVQSNKAKKGVNLGMKDNKLQTCINLCFDIL